MFYFLLLNSFFVMGYSFFFFFYPNWVVLNLCFMSLLVYMSVKFAVLNSNMKLMSFGVFLFSVLFFGVENLLLFYMMYELTMFPIILMVYFYGTQPEKLSSIYYAIIYTGMLSMPFLYVIMNMDGWLVMFFVSPFQYMLLLGLFLSKTPLFLLHLWLPKTHVEAPTPASMMLAGVLLKVGVYGVMKVLLFVNLMSFLVVLFSLFGFSVMCIVTSLCSESKTMVANSSITHMNFCLYGMNIISNMSMSGSYLLSLSHGFVSSMLFCFVGMLYVFNGSRVLFYLLGLFSYMIFFVFSFFFFLLSNAGVPPMLSFWGELLLMISLMNFWIMVLFALFVYFMFSFYYSIFFLMHLMKVGFWLNVDYSFFVNSIMNNMVLLAILLFIF